MNASVNSAIPAAQAAEVHASAQSVAIGDQGETVEVWEYFAHNIDDFATAKTIVDHFSENPKLLDSKELDLHGLFVRAKLTIKRQQISYAQAQEAMRKARESSRSVVGVVRSFTVFVKSLTSAIQANPTPAAIACSVALVLWFR
jgi:hypothetical protein